MVSVNLTRRGFVAVTALVAAMAVAGPGRAFAAPRLYGDGIHDDTDALEHLLNGGKVTAVASRMTAEVDRGTIRLLNAKFRTSRPLRMSSKLNLYAPNCTFLVADGPALPYPVLAASDGIF